MRSRTAAASLFSFALDIGTKWYHAQMVPCGTAHDRNGFEAERVGRCDQREAPNRARSSPTGDGEWISADQQRKETHMLPQLAFFGSIAFSVTAWAIVAARYIWPALRTRARSEALRPLFILHTFRFIGLAYLVPGVVSPDLPRAFATAAAFGDIVAAALALLSLLSLQSAPGLLAAWIFNVWGSVDL